MALKARNLGNNVTKETVNCCLIQVFVCGRRGPKTVLSSCLPICHVCFPREPSCMNIKHQVPFLSKRTFESIIKKHCI